jgi:hypothetical protein
LLPHQASTFRLGIRVKCDAASDVIATAQAVVGVVAVDLTRLYGGSRPVEQTAISQQVRLLASRMRVENGAAKPSELLTLAPGPLDLLEEMP